MSDGAVSVGEYGVTVREFFIGIAGLAGLLVGFVAAPVEVPFVRPVLAVVFLSLVPGVLILQLVNVRPRSLVPYILYTVGLSMIFVMGLGVGMSLILPIFGVRRPLSTGWVLMVLLLIVGMLCAQLYRHEELERQIIKIPRLRITPLGLFALQLPFASVVAITLVNESGLIFPSIVLLCLLSLIPFVILLNIHYMEILPLLLWAVGLALLYYQSLWHKSYPLEMWTHEMVLEMGRWTPAIGTTQADLPNIRGMGYETILPYGTLYPVYILITGVDSMTQLRVINPLFVSLIPLALYEMFRRYIPTKDAFLGTLFFVFSFRFYAQHFPNGARDVIALLFLTLFGLALADSTLSKRNRRILVLTFISGIAVSHYGASYIFLAVLSFSILSTKYMAIADQYLENYQLSTDVSVRRLSYPVGLFAFVAIPSWYIYTAHGIHFSTLPIRIHVFISEGLTASEMHAERALSSSSISVEIARIFHIVVFGMAGIGLVTELYQRILNGTSRIRDEHLTVSYGLLLLFAMTWLSVGTGYGPGRVYIISLAFLAIFAVIALYDIQTVLSHTPQKYRIWNRITRTTFPVHSNADIRGLLAIFLCLFLLLNTGVVAETVTRGDDYGPNQIVNNERIAQSEDRETKLQSQGCLDCDVESFIWVITLGEDGSQVYVDSTMRSYFWYGQGIVHNTDGFVDDYLLTNNSLLYQQDLPTELSEVQSGSYILFNHNNHDTGTVFLANGETRPVEDVENSTGDTDKIYTSGESTVYRT